MRLCIGLTALLLTAPVAYASPTEPTLIHLSGYQDEHVVLEWEVYGEELLSLDLVRILDGEVEVIPLDPLARSYTDTSVPAATDVVYVLYGEFDSGVTTSNAYDSSCRFIAPQEEFPHMRLQPQCVDVGSGGGEAVDAGGTSSG